MGPHIGRAVRLDARATVLQRAIGGLHQADDVAGERDVLLRGPFPLDRLEEGVELHGQASRFRSGGRGCRRSGREVVFAERLGVPVDDAAVEDPHGSGVPSS